MAKSGLCNMTAGACCAAGAGGVQRGSHLCEDVAHDFPIVVFSDEQELGPGEDVVKVVLRTSTQLSDSRAARIAHRRGEGSVMIVVRATCMAVVRTLS